MKASKLISILKAAQKVAGDPDVEVEGWVASLSPNNAQDKTVPVTYIPESFAEHHAYLNLSVENVRNHITIDKSKFCLPFVRSPNP